MNHSVESTSSLFLSAALAGLMGGMLVSCSNDKDKDNNDQPNSSAPTVAATQGQITLTKSMPGLTFAQFSSTCKTRGGLVQTHATCGGSNSCKGMSFNKYSEVLIEHSCRASNTCGGMTCVELPDDSGAEAEALYSKNCGECHGVADETTKIKDPGAFKVYAAPGSKLEDLENAFIQRSADAQVAIVAFGTHGVNLNGTSYSNMPSFYEKLSRAEIERVVAYLRQLKPHAEEYTIFGENLGL